jgi:hypothetical protein
MTTTQAIQEFFSKDDLPPGTGAARPVTNGELLNLRRSDKDGYTSLGYMAADALGAVIDPTTA